MMHSLYLKGSMQAVFKAVYGWVKGDVVVQKKMLLKLMRLQEVKNENVAAILDEIIVCEDWIQR